MNDAQRLGAALMEANVRRIAHVDYDGEVFGNSLQELGERAAAACQEFYAGQSFEIAQLWAYDLKPQPGSAYRYGAKFSAVIR